jgi:hypothetical protein
VIKEERKQANWISSGKSGRMTDTVWNAVQNMENTVWVYRAGFVSLKQAKERGGDADSASYQRLCVWEINMQNADV